MIPSSRGGHVSSQIEANSGAHAKKNFSLALELQYLERKLWLGEPTDVRL